MKQFGVVQLIVILVVYKKCDYLICDKFMKLYYLIFGKVCMYRLVE